MPVVTWKCFHALIIHEADLGERMVVIKMLTHKEVCVICFSACMFCIYHHPYIYGGKVMEDIVVKIIVHN